MVYNYWVYHIIVFPHIFPRKFTRISHNNVVKTTVNHSQIHHVYGWFKPSNMGWFINYCFHHFSTTFTPLSIVNGVYKPTYNWGAPSCNMTVTSFPQKSIEPSTSRASSVRQTLRPRPVAKLHGTWPWPCWSRCGGCAWKPRCRLGMPTGDDGDGVVAE